MKTETNQKNWKVGEVYYQASGILWGREWDIGAQPRETFEEAQADADEWASWLSDREQASARTYVTRFVIDAINEDGSIASAHSEH